MYFKNLREQKTILNNLKLKEKCNKDLLLKLITSTLLKDTFNNVFVKFENERKQLIRYYIEVMDDVKNVKYVRSQNIDYGRVNPECSLGLHSIRREIRHTILKENFIDIDIVNAHPVILSQICDMFNICNKNLFYYIENRDEILKEIMRVHNIDKEKAKKLIISLLNMGSYNKFKKTINAKHSMKYLEELTNELKTIVDELIKLNIGMYTDISKYKSKKSNIKATFMAYYLQTIENKILEFVYLYVKEKNLISDDFLILSNDGLMILKEKFYPELCDEFNKIIFDKMGLDIKYIHKEYNQNYTIEEIEKNQEEPEKIREIMNQIEFIKQMNNQTVDIDDFFNELEISDHLFFTDIYFSLVKNTYIYNEDLGWFSYDKYNKLISYNKEPIDLNNDISRKLKAFLKDKFILLDPDNKNFIKYSKIYKFYCKKVQNTKFVSNVIEKLKELYYVKDLNKLIDSNYKLVAFKDLVYDLEVKEYRKINKEDFIMKHIEFNAPVEDMEEDVIRNDIIDFIYSIQETKENADFLIKIMANSIFYNKYEKLYIINGSGGNGKGVLFSLFEHTIGSYFHNVNSQFLTTKYKGNTPNPDLFNCFNKRCIVVNEPEEDDNNNGLNFNVEFLKKITSNDTVTCRTLHAKPVSFKANFTTFIQTNEIPAIDKIDNALKRRFIIIDFPYKFVENPKLSNEKKVDYTLKEKFNNKKYHQQFIKILLENVDLGDRLNVPEKFVSITNEYFEENDIAYNFFKEYYEITDNKKDYVKKLDLYEHYLTVCDGKPIKKRLFYNQLKERGIEESKYMGMRCFLNIKRKDSDDSNDKPNNQVDFII